MMKKKVLKCLLLLCITGNSVQHILGMKRALERSAEFSVTKKLKSDVFDTASQAINENNIVELQQLVTDKTDAGIKNRLLVIASQSCLTPIIKYLILCGANINTHGSEGYPNPLFAAVARGLNGAVETLVENKAEINAIGSDGKNCLHDAVKMCPLATIRYLVEKKIAINKTDENGHTPLDIAASWNRAPVVTYLLENGATLTKQSLSTFLKNFRNKRIGYDPLHITQCIKIFIAHGAPLPTVFTAPADIVKLMRNCKSFDAMRTATNGDMLLAKENYQALATVTAIQNKFSLTRRDAIVFVYRTKNTPLFSLLLQDKDTRTELLAHAEEFGHTHTLPDTVIAHAIKQSAEIAVQEHVWKNETEKQLIDTMFIFLNNRHAYQ